MPVVYATRRVPVFTREADGPVRSIDPKTDTNRRKDPQTEPNGSHVRFRGRRYTDFSIHEALRLAMREGILSRVERITLADARLRVTRGNATTEDAETIHDIICEISYRWTRKHFENK